MLRLVLNCSAIFRQLGEKTQGTPQAKRSAGPSSPSHGFCDFNGRGGGKNLGGFLRLIMQYLGTSRHKFSWREGEFEES